MAHNVCCDSYHIYNVTYIYCAIVPILGQVCDVCLRAISLDRCSLIGLLVMSVVIILTVLFLVSRWLGGRVCPLVLFVVCYCFLFWISCVLSSSASMKSDHLCSVVTV